MSHGEHNTESRRAKEGELLAGMRCLHLFSVCVACESCVRTVDGEGAVTLGVHPLLVLLDLKLRGGAAKGAHDEAELLNLIAEKGGDQEG